MRKTKPASTRASASKAKKAEAKKAEAKKAEAKKAEAKKAEAKKAERKGGSAKAKSASTARSGKSVRKADADTPKPRTAKASGGTATARGSGSAKPKAAKASRSASGRSTASSRKTERAGKAASGRATDQRTKKRVAAKAQPARGPARAKQKREREKAVRARASEKERRVREKLAREKKKAKKPKAAAKKQPPKRDKGRQAATKQKERLLRQREAERQRKERERERAAREKERVRAAKQREAERRAQKKAAELERKRQKAERDAAQKAREQERKRRDAEREHKRDEARRERDLARVRQKAEREAARVAEKKAREDERLRKQQERDKEKEEARRIKEEERARRDKERDEYRRAKEAEKERLRAEREATRRALEGKVARANKSAQRAAGLLGRGSTTRLYRPSAIPDQSGTRRRLEGELAERLAALRSPALPRELGGAGEDHITFDSPVPPNFGAPDQGALQPAGGNEMFDVAAAEAGAAAGAAVLVPQSDLIEERNRSINERLTRTTEEFRRAYQEELDMSWIYHDSALEGVVYTFQELKTAIDPNIVVVPDSSLQPVCEEIRRHKTAIDLVRELAEKKRVPITVDTVKKIYLTLHPEEGDIKTVKYRRDIPQHRLYFHEYAPPDKIAYKVRQVIDWLNGPEPKKLKSPLKIAARAHYDLVRVFPFAVDSGKVARLLMNLILLRSDYPPAIVHSTERQRYYEALKGQLPIIIQMVTEAIQNGLFSVERKLEEQETRMRSFVS